MKVQKLIFAVVVLLFIGLSTSCSKTDVAEEDALIQSIRKDEIKEEDVM